MAKEDEKEQCRTTASPARNAVREHELDAIPNNSKPIVGPTRPSLDQSASGDDQQPQDSDDSSDDDDFGPQLPPAATAQSSASKRQQEAKPARPSEEYVNAEGTTGTKRQRDDWMVKPPDNSSWASGINPATLRNRKFTSGKSARTDRDSGRLGSVWTESPAQKRQRLENEVLGIKSEADTRSMGPRDLSARANAATASKVKSISNKEGRPSLYESHQKGSHDTKEDEPGSRAFDWEKDIAGKTNMSTGARNKIVKQASDYTSRFAGGKYI